MVAPAFSRTSAKTVSQEVVTGERKPCSEPATRRSVISPSVSSGISAAAVCAKAGAVSSSFIGSATQSCKPCNGSPPSRRSAAVRSEWTMPRPAVIQFTAPGRIGIAVPRLSRWTISPSNKYVTVARPICGCGRTSMPSPALNTAGPKWSKKMNGPTMRERADGSARCTWKPPRSTVRGTISCSMASLACASPKAGSLAGKKLTIRASSYGVERLLFHRLDEAIEHLVDLGPARQLLHVVEPALDIWIGREVAADDFAQRHQSGAEIVGDRDLVAAQILLLRPDPMVVEDLQPALGVLLAELDRGRLRFVAAPLKMREELRIAEVIGPFAIKISVEPVHHFVDL